MGPAQSFMSRFGYLRDPLFLVCAGAYALNRWWLKGLSTSPFVRGHLNDLLLIPAALPVMLWVHRRLQLRHHDDPPSQSEIALHLLVWSEFCEWIGPKWLHQGTPDPWDVVMYAAGSVVAWGVWNRGEIRRRVVSS